MSTDLPTELDNWGPVAESLSEFRTAHEESTRFFAKWFDQVESLLSELLSQQGQWHGEGNQPLGEDAPWSTLLDQLAQMHGQMAETRAEVQRLAEPLESVIQEVPDRQINERLQAEIDALRKEQETILSERLLLESELENVRRRAAELAESLNQQQRSKGEQESYWREEFRRQCVLVERLTSKLVQPSLDSPTVANSLPVATSTPQKEKESHLEVEDLALESVRAQFDLLQEEATRRRKENSGVN